MGIHEGLCRIESSSQRAYVLATEPAKWVFAYQANHILATSAYSLKPCHSDRENGASSDVDDPDRPS